MINPPERVVKRKIRIEGPALAIYAKQVSPNSHINNPTTGLTSFGTTPEVNLRGLVLESAEIYLRYGEHRGLSRGWGFRHIWQARFPQALTREEAEPLVTSMIVKILVSGAGIYYEYGVGAADKRVTVYRSEAGTVAIEHRLDGLGRPYYSIVTAFERSRQNGALVGRMP